jgi:hypothetical protein
MRSRVTPRSGQPLEIALRGGDLLGFFFSSTFSKHINTM